MVVGCGACCCSALVSGRTALGGDKHRTLLSFYMDTKQATRLSKFLSQHLRHQPQAIGLTLQEGGWVSVADLLAACTAHGHPLTRDELEDLVEDNDKQRFAFDEAGQRIRAQQGHSVEVNLQLTPAEPPAAG